VEISVPLAAEGWRLLWHNWFVRDYTAYHGDARAICRQIVEDCWNKTYFEAGTDLLSQFWVRDVGLVVSDLVRLGHHHRLHRCLGWALHVYRRHGRITTTIFRPQSPHDIYEYACDSLPYVLHGLLEIGADDLLREYAEFLGGEARRYRHELLDERTGLVRADRFYPGFKDMMRFRSTCYSMVFMQWTKQLCRQTGGVVPDPFEDLDFTDAILERYWTGTHFRNDAESDAALLSADANLFPFATGVIDDEGMKRAAFETLEQAGFCDPFPIRYHLKPNPRRTEPMALLMLPNYQGNSVWALVGPLYIRELASIDPDRARRHLAAYARHIEQWRTCVEVFEPDGSAPLKGRFRYRAGTGMLWAASYLGLCDDLGV